MENEFNTNNYPVDGIDNIKIGNDLDNMLDKHYFLEDVENKEYDNNVDVMEDENNNHFEKMDNKVDMSYVDEYQYKYAEPNTNAEYINDYESNKETKKSDNNLDRWLNISTIAREERFRKNRKDRAYVLDHFDELTTPEIMNMLFFEGKFVALDAPIVDLDREKVRIRDEFMSGEREFLKELLLSDRIFCKEMMNIIRKEKIDSKKALDLAVELYERIENGTLESKDELEEMDSMTPEERDETHLKNLIQAEKTMCIFFMMAGNPTQLELTIEKENHKDEPPTFGPIGTRIMNSYEESKKQVEVEINPGGRQITY